MTPGQVALALLACAIVFLLNVHALVTGHGHLAALAWRAD